MCPISLVWTKSGANLGGMPTSEDPGPNSSGCEPIQVPSPPGSDPWGCQPHWVSAPLRANPSRRQPFRAPGANPCGCCANPSGCQCQNDLQIIRKLFQGHARMRKASFGSLNIFVKESWICFPRLCMLVDTSMIFFLKMFCLALCSVSDAGLVMLFDKV